MMKTKLAAILVGGSLLVSSVIPACAATLYGSGHTTGGLAITYELTKSSGYAYAGTYVSSGRSVDLITAKTLNTSSGRVDYNQNTRSSGVTTNGQYVGTGGNKLVRSSHKVLDGTYGSWSLLGNNGLSMYY